MPDGQWYTVVSGSGIAQGDILRSCPVPVIDSMLPLRVEAYGQAIRVRSLDLIVLSQSCDLENSNIDSVLLAEVTAWDTIKSQGQDHVKATWFRNALVQGNVAGYSLLRKSELTVLLDWSVADFHRLHLLSKASLEEFVVTIGNRLRMRSPYREHLSQAFARFFMRVGLPHDAREFVKEGR